MQPRPTISGMKARASPGRRAEAVTTKAVKKQNSSISFFTPRPNSSWIRSVSALSTRLSTAVMKKKRIAACRTVPLSRGLFSPRSTARLSSQSPTIPSSSGRSGLAAVTAIASKGIRKQHRQEGGDGPGQDPRGPRPEVGTRAGGGHLAYLYSRGGAPTGMPR